MSTPMPSKGRRISGCRSSSNTPLAFCGALRATDLRALTDDDGLKGAVPPVVTREAPAVESVARMPSEGGMSAMTDIRTRLTRRR